MPPGWKLQRAPKCNRVAGHPDRHREVDKRTFAPRAEWDEADVPELPKRRPRGAAGGALDEIADRFEAEWYGAPRLHDRRRPSS